MNIKIIILSLLTVMCGCSVKNPLTHNNRLKKCECSVIYADENSETCTSMILSLNLAAFSYVMNNTVEIEIYEVGTFKIDEDTLKLHTEYFMIKKPQSNIRFVNDSSYGIVRKDKRFLIHRKKLIEIRSENDTIKAIPSMILSMQKE